MMFFKRAFDRRTMVSTVTRIAAALVMLSLLASCVKPQNRREAEVGEDGEKDLAAATFLVESFEGSSQDGEMIKGFSVPKSRVYNFSACLKTARARSREALIGHRFTILGGESEAPVTTDSKGCANWSETIGFNYISEERYLTLVRTIRATGVHKGAREVKFAINPWNLDGRSDKAIDLKKASLPSEHLVEATAAKNLLEGKSASGTSITRPLWLGKLEIEVAPVAGKAQAELNRKLVFSFQPSILMKDLRGNEMPIALKDAKLNFKASLMGVTDGKPYPLFTSQPLQVVRDGDLFRAESEPQPVFNISQKQLKLVVRAEPIDGPAGLEAFEANYEITGSDLSSYGTVKPVFVSRIAQANGANALEAGALVAEPLGASGALPSGITRAKRFRLSPIAVSNISPIDEATTERTVTFNATVCITDTTTGKPAVDMEFSVTKANGEVAKDPSGKAPRTSSEPGQEGCLTWENDSVTHKVFESEHYFVRNVVIRHPATGFEETIGIALNPWELNRFNFMRNVKGSEQHIAEVNARPSQPARLLFKSYSFNTEDVREYEVDDYLRPTMIKKFQFKLEAVTSRPTIALGQGAMPELLRKGKYLFRAVAYVQYKDPHGELVEVVTSMARKAVRVDVDNGTATIEAHFKVRDPRALSARSTIFFELHPLDDKKMKEAGAESLSGGPQLETFIDAQSGLQTPTYAAAFWVGDESGSPIVIATDRMRVHTQEDLDREDMIVIDRSTKQVLKLADIKEKYANLNVASIETQKKSLEDKILNQVIAESRLERILENGNLDYVPLMNESKIFAAEPKLATANRILPKAGAVTKLLDVLNLPLSREARKTGLAFPQDMKYETFTTQTLVDLIEGKREMDLPMAVRLCVYYFEEAVPRMLPKMGPLYNGEAWVRGCAARVQKDLRSVFVVDRKLRIFQVDQKAESLGALNMSFLLGADVTFYNNSSNQYSGSVGISPAKIAEEIAKGAAGALAAIWKPLGLVSYLSGFGLRGDLTATTSESTTISEGSRLSTGTPMSRIKDRLRISVRRSESCAVIRLSPAFWERKEVVTESFLNVAGHSPEALKAMSRGLFVCSGVQKVYDKEPLRIVENFYTIDQDVRIDGKFDHGNLQNHPWLMAIRGENDYSQFMKFVAAKKSSPSQVPQNIQVEEYSAERMEAAYKAYRGYTPNAPGVYTIRTVIPDPAAEEPKSNIAEWWRKHF